MILVIACGLILLLVSITAHFDRLREWYYLNRLEHTSSPGELIDRQRSIVSELGRLRSRKSIPVLIQMVRSKCYCTQASDDPFGLSRDCIDEAIVEIGWPALADLIAAISFTDEESDIRLANLVSRIHGGSESLILLDLISLAPELEAIGNDPQADARLREVALHAWERLTR